MKRIVTVTAQRSGKWWVLECAESGSVSQCSTLTQADAEMREAIAFQMGLAEDAFDITVQIVAPMDFLLQVSEAEQLHSEAARLSRKAAVARARAAKTLSHHYSMSIRDIGRVMGISYQRAQQLVAA